MVLKKHFDSESPKDSYYFINYLDYEKLDISDVRFILSQFIKNNFRKTEKHISYSEYFRFCHSLNDLISEFSN